MTILFPAYRILRRLRHLTPILALGFAFCLAGAAHAESKAAAPAASTPDTTAAPATPAPATPTVATPGAPPDAEGSDHGDTSSETVPTVEVAARPTAILSAKAKWDEAFTSIKTSQAKLLAAVEKAGLKPAGRPMTVFTETNDTGFSYEAMLPLAEKPGSKTELSDMVTLGVSPSGKALKFQHHGPYDDIDSTYDLITAYLDEKSLEAQDYFVEDYMSDLKSANDPNLAVDIYIFLK